MEVINSNEFKEKGRKYMRLELENIGKLSHANIELKGITVIAGENNTGKSTIGKVLYSVFNSFYNFENVIKETRINLFAQIIRRELRSEFPDIYYYIFRYSVDIAKEIFQTPQENVTNEFISALIEHIVEDHVDVTYDDSGIPIDNIKSIDVPERFVQFVLDNYPRYYKEISDKQIFTSVLTRSIKEMFHSQLNNFYKNCEGTIFLQIKDKITKFVLGNNQVKSITDTLSLNTQILYLDNPFILDEWGLYMTRNPFAQSSTLSYRRQLLEKLLPKKSKSNIEAVFKEAVIEDKINGSLSKINTICDGDLSFESNEGFSYRTNGAATIDSNNISAGLKTFIIIKTLLTNGSIEENGTIVLDEPEIHLHPEWQLLFAEIIVLLQKEFNLHILLTTHSPYFLEAIEAYSERYKIADKCKYYLAKNVGKSAVIDDVTESVEKIYKELAKPLQTLENIGDNDD